MSRSSRSLLLCRLLLCRLSRSTSSVPWIIPEVRRKIRRRNRTHAKAKKTGSSKLRENFESLRKDIKVDVKKQHDLYVNNLVGVLVILRLIPETSTGTLIVKRKTRKVSHLSRGEMAVAWQSQSWNRQRNLTVSLRMCSTKANIPKSPSLIVRLLS